MASQMELDLAAHRYRSWSTNDYERSDGDFCYEDDQCILANAYCTRLASIRAEREEMARIIHASRSAIEYALTCDRANDGEWMRGLAERINAWCEAVGERDRAKYNHRRGSFQIIRGGSHGGGGE